MVDGTVSGLGENNRVGGRPPRICASYWGNPIEESQEWTSNSVQSSRFGLSSVLAIDDEYEVRRPTRRQFPLAKDVVSLRKVFLIRHLPRQTPYCARGGTNTLALQGIYRGSLGIPIFHLPFTK